MLNVANSSQLKVLAFSDSFLLSYQAHVILHKSKQNQTVTSVSEVLKKFNFRDFPGGPMVRTPCSQCWGHRFHPWAGS